MSDLAEKSRQLTAKEQKSAWNEAYHQGHPRWRGSSDLDLSELKGKILELGCGDGKTAIAMVEMGFEVVGLDASRTAISALDRRIRSERLFLVQGDALNLPFLEGSFDCLALVHFIDHLLASDRGKAVEEMGKVLKPGGLILGRFFSINDMRCGKGEEIERHTYLRGNGVFNHYFTEEEIIHLFIGYRVLSIRTSNKPTKFPSDSGFRSLITAELKKM